MTAQDKYTSIGLSSVQSKCDFKVLSYVSSIILERLKNTKNGGQKSPWAWEWFRRLSVKNIWKKTIHRHKSTCHPRQIYKKSFQFIIFIKWRQCVFPWCWWGHISEPVSIYSIFHIAIFFQKARAGHHQQIVNPLKVPHLMMKRSLWRSVKNKNVNKIILLRNFRNQDPDGAVLIKD